MALHFILTYCKMTFEDTFPSTMKGSLCDDILTPTPWKHRPHLIDGSRGVYATYLHNWEFLNHAIHGWQRIDIVLSRFIICISFHGDILPVIIFNKTYSQYLWCSHQRRQAMNRTMTKSDETMKSIFRFVEQVLLAKRRFVQCTVFCWMVHYGLLNKDERRRLAADKQLVESVKMYVAMIWWIKTLTLHDIKNYQHFLRWWLVAQGRYSCSTTPSRLLQKPLECEFVSHLNVIISPTLVRNIFLQWNSFEIIGNNSTLIL